MPGGASIVLSTINMHRSPEWWGDDADEFSPDRWQKRREVPLAYRPFNAGPRTVRLTSEMRLILSVQDRRWR
jgi:cytochrome P450